MTVLEKIKRCVSLVWDFQEIYDEEDIEDFCRNELHTYPQYNEIMEYFKHIAELEEINANLKQSLDLANERESEDVKRIKDLEKENKVLAQNLEDTEILNKTYEKRFKDLKKENSELKTKVTALENANRAMVKELDDTTSGGLNILQNVVKNKEQLTKAKELLKQWLQTSKNNSCDNINIVTDTEKFISEVEK